MLAALRHAANIFGVTVANLRSAKELEKRHQLDRYLAPQIVDSILAGHPEIVTTKNRRLITIFFSDIKDFSILADRLDPGTLAVVLNDYLSEMAEIAFSFGGTVDLWGTIGYRSGLASESVCPNGTCNASSDESAERRMDRKRSIPFEVDQSHGHLYWRGNGRELWQRQATWIYGNRSECESRLSARAALRSGACARERGMLAVSVECVSGRVSRFDPS